MQFRILLLIAVVAAPLGLIACGGSNPASSTGAGGVTVEGVLLGEGAAFTASGEDGSGGSGSGPITVEVVGTGLSVTISGNGTFKIEDIPQGGITLRFLQDGKVLAEISIPYSPDGTTVKIVVKKQGSVIVLVDLKMDDDDIDPDDPTIASCTISGGREGDRIELEGDVASGGGKDFHLSTNRSSHAVHILAEGAEFKCNGKTAGDGECWEAVKPTAKVHVRGTLTTCTSASAEVTADQVKVQKAAS